MKFIPFMLYVISWSPYMMGTNIAFELFIVELILRIAPQCAKQKNETGLLPLQIVADTERRPYIRDKDRIALVGTIWRHISRCFEHN